MSESSLSPRRHSRFGWWIFAGLALCLVLIALRFGLPVWQRASFLDDIQAIGGSVKTSPGGPVWLRELLGDSAMRGFDEVWSLGLPGERRADELELGFDDPLRVGRPAPKIEDGVLNRMLLFPDLLHFWGEGATFSSAGIAVLGDHPGLTEIHLLDSNLDDEGLLAISNSRSILLLSAGGTRVTDAGLSRLGQMAQLQILGLRGNDVTDAGLHYLDSLTNLTLLVLSETRITDAGLRHLSAAKKLQWVHLFDTGITEAGVLDFVACHPDLEELELSPDQISADGIDDLKRQRPNLKIVITVEENDGSGFSRRRSRRQ